MSSDALSTITMHAYEPAAASTPTQSAPSAAPTAARAKPAPVAAAQARPSEEAVRIAAEQIESYLQSSGRSLDFHVDSASGETVISVRDAGTGELIRQIPGDDVLKMARALKEGAGSLLNITA